MELTEKKTGNKCGIKILGYFGPEMDSPKRKNWNNQKWTNI